MGNINFAARTIGFYHILKTPLLVCLVSFVHLAARSKKRFEFRSSRFLNFSAVPPFPKGFFCLRSHNAVNYFPFPLAFAQVPGRRGWVEDGWDGRMIPSFLSAPFPFSYLSSRFLSLRPILATEPVHRLASTKLSVKFILPLDLLVRGCSIVCRCLNSFT